MTDRPLPPEIAKIKEKSDKEIMYALPYAPKWFIQRWQEMFSEIAEAFKTAQLHGELENIKRARSLARLEVLDEIEKWIERSYKTRIAEGTNNQTLKELLAQLRKEKEGDKK